MKNYHVRYAPLANRLEIVRTHRPDAKGRMTVAARKDATAEVMHSVVNMMHSGLTVEPGQGIVHDFNLGGKRYKMTLREVTE